jgi:hypothetical protein
MKIFKVSQIENPSNPLNGKSNEQARKILRNIVTEPSRGLFSDEYWLGPNNIFKALSASDIDWTLESAEYGVSPSFQQNWTGEKWKIPNDYKQWKFTVKFVNNKSRETILNCNIMAMGAGTTDDPLSKYDMSVMIG